MYVGIERLYEAYDKIREGAVHSKGKPSVLILVTPNVDAICGLKIITSLFRSDSILYGIYPVSGCSGLKSANETHINPNDDLRTIIALNFGALIDIASIITIKNGITLHVIDPHKPCNLKLLFCNEQILIWGEGENNESHEKAKIAYEALLTIEAIKKTEEEATSSHESVPLDENLLAKNVKELQKIVKKYYQSVRKNGIGVSALLYTLSTQLGRQTQTILWGAIVGLTDQLLNDSISQYTYDTQASFYSRELRRFNNASTTVPTKKSFSQKSQFDSLLNTPEDSNTDNDEYTAYDASDNSIKYGLELKFVLLRHWSLYESMYHSVFINSKLGLWREKNRKKLLNLLVKMGFPHKECFQRYSQMSTRYKHLVKKRLVQVAHKYNVDNILFKSFWKHYGYKGTFSSSDVVYSLSALLELGLHELPPINNNNIIPTLHSSLYKYNNINLYFNNPENTNEFSNVKLAGVGAGTLKSSCAMDNSNDYYSPHNGPNDKNTWVSNFYIAYDALNSFNLLYHGVISSISLKKLLIATVTAILEKNLMQILTGFQLAILRNNSTSDNSNHYLSSSLKSLPGEYTLFGKNEACLCSLTMFLYKTCIKFKKKLPTVVAAFNATTNTYLVAGFAEYDVIRSLKSPIGVAFQSAASKTGIKIRSDSFNSSVVEVSHDEISDFLECLQLCIS